jgi:hypothetical protein
LGVSDDTNVEHAVNTDQRQLRFVLHVSGPKRSGFLLSRESLRSECGGSHAH